MAPGAAAGPRVGRRGRGGRLHPEGHAGGPIRGLLRPAGTSAASLWRRRCPGSGSPRQACWRRGPRPASPGVYGSAAPGGWSGGAPWDRVPATPSRLEAPPPEAVPFLSIGPDRGSVPPTKGLGFP